MVVERPLYLPVMAGHSRLKDGVASARLCPAIHVFLAAMSVKTWMPGTSPGHDENQSSGSPRMLCDAFDEEIDDRFRGALGLRVGDAPARKMSVDVHPRKAVNQSAAGDLDLLQIRRAQLALRAGLRQRPLGHADHLAVVPRQLGRLVVIEIPAARDDLEMGR